MAWRAARSLLVLRDQLNAAYPGRNKASDGTIGDEEHQAEVSDHNPDDDVDGDGVGEGPGVDDIVRALDVTHDPAHGLDIDQLSDALIGSRDPRISYVIANRMISGPNYGWQWAGYDGDDPHTGHLHLSVIGDSRADDARPWNIGNPAGVPATGQGEDMDQQERAALLGSFEILSAMAGGDTKTWNRPVKVEEQIISLGQAVATLTAKVDSVAAALAGMGHGPSGALTKDDVRAVTKDEIRAAFLDAGTP
jgi:hypothetical protein